MTITTSETNQPKESPRPRRPYETPRAVRGRSIQSATLTMNGEPSTPTMASG